MADEVVLPNTLVAGTPEDVTKVQGNFEALRDKINGNLANGNISAAAAIELSKLEGTPADELGLNSGGVVRRGKSIIATEETRTNSAYGLMPTPDRVSGIVLSTDGLIAVTYRATWKVTGAAGNRQAYAAFFLGAQQLRRSTNAASPDPMELNHTFSAGEVYRPLESHYEGSFISSADTAYTGDVTTGQVASRGLLLIEAAAGTYDLSVQFKGAASPEPIVVKNRKLRVWTMGF